MVSATTSFYSIAGLGGLVVGKSIAPIPDGGQHEAVRVKGWQLNSGVYTARQTVEGFAPLLDTVVHCLGQDLPNMTPARKMLLDNVTSNLAISTRESTLSFPPNLSDASRKEIAEQAKHIGKKLVQYAANATNSRPDPNLAIRSPCEGHLLTHSVAELMFGPRSQHMLMQLFNEYIHQMVLLRDSLLPFQNWHEVLIPINAKAGLGMRYTESARSQFLTFLFTKSVTQASVISYAKAVLAFSSPARGGYGFQYAQGMVIPTLLVGGSSRHLLQYIPAILDQSTTDVLFDYEFGDYYSAPRAEVPKEVETLSPGFWPPTSLAAMTSAVEKSSVGIAAPIKGGKDASRQLRLQIEFENGVCAAVDLGQIARGRRYAYQTSTHSTNGVQGTTANSAGGLSKASALHSASSILTSSGSALITSKHGGIHIIPAHEPIVALALLGKLYPENVILLPEGEDAAAAEKAGKSFEPRFVIWEIRATGVPEGAIPPSPDLTCETRRV